MWCVGGSRASPTRRGPREAGGPRTRGAAWVCVCGRDEWCVCVRGAECGVWVAREHRVPGEDHGKQVGDPRTRGVCWVCVWQGWVVCVLRVAGFVCVVWVRARRAVGAAYF